MGFQATVTHLSSDTQNQPQQIVVRYYYTQLPEEEAEAQ